MSPRHRHGALQRLATLIFLQAYTVTDGATEIDVQKGLYLLNEDVFKPFVKRFRAVMVAFIVKNNTEWQMEHFQNFETAGRKLRKLGLQVSDSHGVRLGKVDSTQELALRNRWGVSNKMKFLVFKDGKFFYNYQGGLDKEDVVDYMTAFLSSEPLGTFQRSYCLLRSWFKYAVRSLPFLERRDHPYAWKAFPWLLTCTLIYLLLVIWSWQPKSKRSRTRKKVDPLKAEGKEKEELAAGKRMHCTDVDGKKITETTGMEGAKAGEDAKEEKAAEDAKEDPKEDEEKKDD